MLKCYFSTYFYNVVELATLTEVIVYAMCKSKTCNCCTKVTFKDWYTFVGSRFFVLFFVVIKVRLLTPYATFVYIQVSQFRAIIGVFITIVITSLLYNKLSNNFSKVMPLKTKKIWAGIWLCAIALRLCYRHTDEDKPNQLFDELCFTE